MAQARHFIVFGCTDSEDRKYLAQQMSVDHGLLCDALDGLDRFEFLYWRVGGDELLSCPKLRRR